MYKSKQKQKHRKIKGGTLEDQLDEIQNLSSDEVNNYINNLQNPTEVLKALGYRTTNDIIAGTGKKLNENVILESDKKMLKNILKSSKEIQESPKTKEYNEGYNSIIDMWERDQDPYELWSEKWDKLNAIDPKTGDFLPYLKGQVDGLTKLREEIPKPPKREPKSAFEQFKEGFELPFKLLGF